MDCSLFSRDGPGVRLRTTRIASARFASQRGSLWVAGG
jgi:hypothetical protein